MKSAVRIIVIILVAILVLFGLLAAYLMFVFDPNDHRARIASEVERATGRTLAIDGDISLSVFPWIGVAIDAVRLGNAEGFGETPFAEVGKVEARARLMPLLRSQLDIDRVVLHGLRLNLQRDAQGRSNWEDLAARGGVDEQTASESPGSTAAGATAAIVVAGVEVSDARVVFADQQAGTEYTVEGLDLKTGEVRPGSRFPLELGFNVAASEPKLSGRVDAFGEVLFDLDGPKADVQDFSLKMQASGEGLPGGKAEASLTAGLAMDLAAGTLAVSDLRLKSYGVELRGQLSGQGLNDAPAFSGLLEVPQFDPRALFAALGMEAPVTADSGVLKRASLKSRVEASDSAAALRELTLVLDDSTLAGELAVADFAKQALRFDLALDAIDLDRYLPPAQQDKAQPQGAGGAGAPAGDEGDSGQIDPALLRGLDVIGKLRIGQLKVSGASLSEILVELQLQGGVLKLAPVASLYGGRYAGNVGLDGRGQTLALSLDESLSGLQVGPLLRDLSGEDEKLTGNASLQARLQARGNDADALMRTLNGTAQFRFLDGAVKGINVAHYLRMAQARLTGRPAPDVSEPNQTDFTELAGSLKVVDGVVHNDDLDARSPLLRVSGEGSASLPQETIDYVVRASVVASLAGQGGEGLESLKGVTVPIKVSGSFSQPSFGLDVESLLTDNVKQQARERLEEAVQEKLSPELQEKLSPDLQENLQKGLGRLLGR